MGWGIVGGAAVKAYNEQGKANRDADWDALKKQEYLRQLGMQKSIDEAANGDDTATPAGQGVPMAPTADAAPPAPQQGTGLRMPAGPDAPAFDSSLAGNPDATPVAPNVPQAPTAPATPAVVSPQQKPQKMSDQYFSRAKALMNARGGVEGMKQAQSMFQTGTEMAKQERDQELVGILQSNVPTATKAQQLVGVINGTHLVPGNVELEQRPDGFYMVHSAPGKDKPFAMKLEGSNEQEVIGNLALKVRAMYDSGLQMKLMEHGFNKDQLAETSRHNRKTEDNTAERNSDRALYESGMLGARADATAARLEMAGLRNQAMSDKAARQNWQSLGKDKDGNEWERDSVFGEVRKVNVPAGITLYPKQTGLGGKGGTGLEHDMSESQKLAYQRALQDFDPKWPVAKRKEFAESYGLPPSKFGVPEGAIPSPAALGAPPKASAPAPVAGKGLQVPTPRISRYSTPIDFNSGAWKHNSGWGSPPEPPKPPEPTQPVDVGKLRQAVTYYAEMVGKTARFPAQQQDWKDLLQAAQAKLATVQSK